jgi:hypothetical protein
MTLEYIMLGADHLAQAREGYDFSMESLALLDQDLTATHQELLARGDPASILSQDQTMSVLQIVAACYAGEVLRRNVGGEWRFPDASWPTLASPGCTIFPFARTHNFLTEGPENDWRSLASSYQAFNAFLAAEN